MSQLLSLDIRADLDLRPPEVAARLRDKGGLVFFDAALAGADSPSLSIVAADPSEVLSGSGPADWETLRSRMAARSRVSGKDSPFPAGFAAGWVEYDGAFRFGIYDSLLIFDHRTEEWFQYGNIELPEEPPRPPFTPGPVFTHAVGRAEFCRMVGRAQEYIAAGDIYQVNLSHCFRAKWHGDAFSFYRALRHYSPAPCAAFVELGDRSVLSASPESFLRISGRQVRTRPIKGTRPRKRDHLADERSAYDLLTSPKEVAELVMITDLERSDLGQVCEYGSVRVTELLKLERFEQVFHLVSTIEGELRSEVDHVTALKSCFPGGSITGAPKKRAMEIIAELEPEPRGLYTGAIGYFGFNAESHFNIAIRTAVVEEGEARFHVGAGIVADSVPDKEYQETLDKAAGILMAAERME